MKEVHNVKITSDLSMKLREFIERVIIINNSGDKEDKIISQVKSQ